MSQISFLVLSMMMAMMLVMMLMIMIVTLIVITIKVTNVEYMQCNAAKFLIAALSGAATCRTGPIRQVAGPDRWLWTTSTALSSVQDVP